jgi:hypothetical protein
MSALLTSIDWRLVGAVTVCLVLCGLAVVFAERIALTHVDELGHVWPESEALHPDIEALVAVHDNASLAGEARDHA